MISSSSINVSQSMVMERRWHLDVKSSVADDNGGIIEPDGMGGNDNENNALDLVYLT